MKELIKNGALVIISIMLGILAISYVCKTTMYESSLSKQERVLLWENSWGIK